MWLFHEDFMTCTMHGVFIIQNVVIIMMLGSHDGMHKLTCGLFIYIVITNALVAC